MKIPTYKNTLYAAFVLYALTIGYKSNYKTNIRYKIVDPEHLINNSSCKAFIERNKTAIERYVNNGRVVVTEEPDLSMRCQDIRNRIKHFSHIDNKEDVPFAIARNVYSDYFMQEIFLGLHYSTENTFFFALDLKSPNTFKDKMRKMADCLPNVQVMDKEYNFTSGGHFQDISHFDCIRQLLKLPKWTYVLLQQNNDLIIKTKSEIAQILKVMNGTQLVGSQNPWKLEKHFPYELMPNAEVGKIFKNESGRSESQLRQNISYVKGLNEMFLSREFVQALDTQLNMDHLLSVFNSEERFGVDEFLLPSLVFNGHLGLAGQSSKVCWHPKDYPGPVRYHSWAPNVKCKGLKRHSLCMMTVEYLPEMIYRREIVVNKIWPASDFGAALCMIGILKERALLNLPMVGLKHFASLSQVQEMRQKNLGTFDVKTFKCPGEKKNI